MRPNNSLTKLTLLPLVLFMSLLIGCGTTGLLSTGYVSSRRHPEFTTSAVLKIIKNITPEEIVKRFGNPDRTSIKMMGTETPNPWQALVYEYVMGPHPDGAWEVIDNVNYFYFSVDLNNLEYWEIELAYQDNYSTQDQQIETNEILFYDGKYVGETKMGYPHGEGSFFLNSGDKYEGHFVNGNLVGEGKWYYTDGNILEGSFLNGFAHGKCTSHFSIGDRLVAEYENGEIVGQVTYYYHNGDVYEGEFTDHTVKGTGTLYYKNGDKYEGEFINHSITGNGIFYFTNGDKYEGQFLNGRAVNGICTYSDGTSERCHLNEAGEWITE